jgi:hypothetical protein
LVCILVDHLPILGCFIIAPSRFPHGGLRHKLPKRKKRMKLLAMTFALCTALPAQAGGPVIIEEPFESAPAPTLSPGEKLALAAGLIVVGAMIFGGGSDDCPCLTPDEGGQCTC